MTVVRPFVDAEDVALAWLKSTSVAALVTHGSKVHCYQAMPKGAPVPCVVLSRVGGAPERGDVPVDMVRISFEIWAANRPQCKAIKLALIGEIESVEYQPAFVGSGGRIQSAETLSDIWFPDEESDTPRYIVDALFPVQAT